MQELCCALLTRRVSIVARHCACAFSIDVIACTRACPLWSLRLAILQPWSHIALCPASAFAAVAARGGHRLRCLALTLVCCTDCARLSICHPQSSFPLPCCCSIWGAVRPPSSPSDRDPPTTQPIVFQPVFLSQRNELCHARVALRIIVKAVCGVLNEPSIRLTLSLRTTRSRGSSMCDCALLHGHCQCCSQRKKDSGTTSPSLVGPSQKVRSANEIGRGQVALDL